MTPISAMPNLVIKQDAVELYEPTLLRFFAHVFGMDYSCVLMTNDAQLSDFSFSGEDEPDLDQSPSLAACYDAWDKWVLQRTCEVFDLEPGSFNTRIRMTELMARIEERTARRVH